MVEVELLLELNRRATEQARRCRIIGVNSGIARRRVLQHSWMLANDGSPHSISSIHNKPSSNNNSTFSYFLIFWIFR